MALVKLEIVVYEPTFNIDTNKYYDKSPFEANKRGNNTYRCGCKNDCYYSNNSEFNRHIKNKYHIKWLENYKEPEFMKEMKEYKKLIEEKENEIKRCHFQMKKIIKEYEEQLKEKDLLLDKIKKEHIMKKLK